LDHGFYTGSDIPLPGSENVRINLWLDDINGDNFGDPPSDSKEAELIVKKFEYIAPASVTDIQASPGRTWINWSWKNPQYIGFGHVMLYLNGTFITNIFGPQNFYNTTGLSPDTSYELGTRTVDTSGNINQTWVNRTAKTLPSGELRGDVNRNSRRDTGDATLVLRNIVGLPIPSTSMPIMPIGDMNCNSRIDTGDATLILRDVVGLPTPKCWE